MSCSTELFEDRRLAVSWQRCGWPLLRSVTWWHWWKAACVLLANLGKMRIRLQYSAVAGKVLLVQITWNIFFFPWCHPYYKAPPCYFLSTVHVPQAPLQDQWWTLTKASSMWVLRINFYLVGKAGKYIEAVSGLTHYLLCEKMCYFQ